MFAPAGIVDMLARFVFSDAFQFEFFRKPHRKETLQLEVQLLGLISKTIGVFFILIHSEVYKERDFFAVNHLTYQFLIC